MFNVSNSDQSEHKDLRAAENEHLAVPCKRRAKRFQKPVKYSMSLNLSYCEEYSLCPSSYNPRDSAAYPKMAVRKS